MMKATIEKTINTKPQIMSGPEIMQECIKIDSENLYVKRSGNFVKMPAREVAYMLAGKVQVNSMDDM